MSDIIPLFSLTPSRKEGGIFTIEPAKKEDAKPSKGAISLCDLAKRERLSKIHIVESNFISFMNAYKNLKKVNCNIVFGLKLIVTDNIADKSEESFKNESKIIIFLDNDVGYQALVDIYTKAATDGFYFVPRIDWKTLRFLWNDNLILALPFYSSFLAKNALTFTTIVPDLPAVPEVLIEVGQKMPFDSILETAARRFAENNNVTPQLCKSIYYHTKEDAKKFLIWRCIFERGSSWDSPRQDHMCSDRFSWEDYKELIK